LWRRKLEESIDKHGWAFKDGVLVVKDGHGALYAFHTENGELAWRTKDEDAGFGASGPTIAGSSVISTTQAGYEAVRLRAWGATTPMVAHGARTRRRSWPMGFSICSTM
jgi:outer membrane protein assembly factor BamB